MPTNDSIEEVQSPMLLEISLDKAKLHLLPVGYSWSTTETERFHCDKARVTKTEVFKRKGKKGKVKVEIAPTLATDWYRQDVDLTIALLGHDGQEIGQQTWTDLTIGKDQLAKDLGFFGASKSKSRVLAVEMSKQELEALYEGGAAPRLKIVLAIKE